MEVPTRPLVHEVKISIPVIISGGALQAVTECRSQSDQKDHCRRSLEKTAQGQVHVNAGEDQMIDKAINDSAFSTLSAGQTCKLTVRVVEQIGADMKRHPGDVDCQIPIEIKMAGNDSEYAAKKRDPDRRHSELCEKLRELETKLAIKVKIEDALGLAHLVGGFDGGRLRELRRHSRSHSERQLRHLATQPKRGR